LTHAARRTLGTATGSLLLETDRRNIPAQRLDNDSLILFGILDTNAALFRWIGGRMLNRIGPDGVDCAVEFGSDPPGCKDFAHGDLTFPAQGRIGAPRHPHPLHCPIISVIWTCSSDGLRNVCDTPKRRYQLPAKTNPPTGYETTCLATADHFIDCRGSKPASRIRARFDQIDQAEAFALTFGDSSTMI
jgi:hypothetical protein